MPDVSQQTGSAAHDDGLAAFVAARPRLFGIAYRMLGSAAEAEDVVQDAWLRWQNTDRGTVRDAAAFLATTTTRLALNLLQSAHARRETYVGPWLPEPVDTSADPNLGAERGEALQMAVLLLLEKLTATERAAYVLREAFDYPHRQIAEMLQLSEANVRQLVTRARAHIANGRRAAVSAADHQRLLHAFLTAAQTGEVAALEAMFAADVVSYSDGGGFVRAARRPVQGRARVASFVAAFASHYWSGVTLAEAETNGQPSMLILRDDAVIGLVAITASPDGIEQLLWLMRPSKLAALSRPSAP